MREEYLNCHPFGHHVLGAVCLASSRSQAGHSRTRGVNCSRIKNTFHECRFLTEQHADENQSQDEGEGNSLARLGSTSAASITLITAIMKAQLWPWQRRCWGKTKGQIHRQEAGTDPDQQMVCNNDSIRRFLSANRAEHWLGGHRSRCSKGSVPGEGFLGACWTSALENPTSR